MTLDVQSGFGRLSSILICAVICVVASPACAATFEENWDDGQADGWNTTDLSGDGVFDASGGFYHIRSNGPADSVATGVQAAIAEDTGGPNFANGVLSFDISNDTLETAAGVEFRLDAANGNWYHAQLITEPSGQSAVLIRFDAFQPQTPMILLQNVWSPGQTYHFEVTFDGPNFGLRVVEQGTGMEWSGTAMDDTYMNGGQLGLLSSVSPFTDLGEYGARFDNLRLEPIPEPSTAVLLFLSVVGFLTCSRSRRRSTNAIK